MEETICPYCYGIICSYNNYCEWCNNHRIEPNRYDMEMRVSEKVFSMYPKLVAEYIISKDDILHLLSSTCPNYSMAYSYYAIVRRIEGRKSRVWTRWHKRCKRSAIGKLVLDLVPILIPDVGKQISEYVI